MKRIQISEFGGPEILQIVEQDDISPGLDEITVDVEYIGVGLVDSLLREGFIELAFPFVPGLEVSGYVREVGENATEFKVEQPVAVPLLLNFGGYATIFKRQ